MPYPSYFPGDKVLIRSYGNEGLSRVLEGKEATIVRNLGKELRERGSKVSSAYYRVYIPELEEERSVKGHFLEMVEPMEGHEGLRREDYERRRWGTLDAERGFVERGGL